MPTVTVVEKPPVPVVSEIDYVTITLSVEEAAMIRYLTGRVSGGPHGWRTYSDAIYYALNHPAIVRVAAIISDKSVVNYHSGIKLGDSK